MAFFGLTALGPQNSFEAVSVTHRTIQIFDDQDFIDAWERVCGKRFPSFATKDDLVKIFKVLYHGPVPRNDIQPLDDAFYYAFGEEEAISREVYLRVMDRLRREAEEEEKANEGKPKPGCEFISSSEFRESLKKNAAIKKDPRQKVVAPLTAMQEVFIPFRLISSKIKIFLLSMDGNHQRSISHLSLAVEVVISPNLLLSSLKMESISKYSYFLPPSTNLVKICIFFCL